MKNKIIITFLAGVMLLAMAMIVSGYVITGDTTVNSPQTGKVMNGSYVVNITTTVFANMTNCSVKMNSALTGHTLNFTSVHSSGTGGEKASTNDSIVTINTFLLSDASDYILTGVCHNLSNRTNPSHAATAIAEITGIIVDNTEPTCTIDSALTSSNTYSSTQTWALNGSNSTSARIKFGGNSFLTMTRNTANASHAWYYVLEPSPPWDEGIYTISAETSDGVDTTACTGLTEVNIDDEATKMDLLWLNQQNDHQKSILGTQSTINVLGTEVPQILVWGVLIFAGIMLFKGKKKK